MKCACSSAAHTMGSCQGSHVLHLLSFTSQSTQPALLGGAHWQQLPGPASVDGFWSVFCFTVAMSCFNKMLALGLPGLLFQAEDARLQAACLFAFSCKCWRPLPQPRFPLLLLLLLFNSTLEGTADEMPLNLNCQQWK